MKSNHFFTFLIIFFSLIHTALYAQKDVMEDCNDKADCKSGNCVTLRSGEKKCSNCDQSTLDNYTSKVDEKCKDQEKGLLGYSDLVKEFGSKNDVSLLLLYTRQEACKSCYQARSDRENSCWSGGDAGHKTQLEELKKAMNYLEGVISEKTRYNLAYNCEPDRFEDTMEDLDENCKGLTDLFNRYGINNNQRGNCDEIEDLVEKCIDCREAWNYLESNCFRNGLSDERRRQRQEVIDMERIATETLAAKREGNLCD